MTNDKVTTYTLTFPVTVTQVTLPEGLFHYAVCIHDLQTYDAYARDPSIAVRLCLEKVAVAL